MRGQLSLNRTTRHKQQLILVLLMTLASGGVTAAQSNDRHSPTPFSSDTIKGTNAGDYVIKLGGAVELPGVESSARGITPPTISLPDLVVQDISFDQSPSRIRVRVLNRGNAPSSNCFLALQSLAGDDPSLVTKRRVWIIEIPALEAGKGFSNAIDVSPLTQTIGRWKAVVDWTNTVKESNEDNNSLLFPPGSDGPTSELSDLVVDHFEITDPSRGKVRIQVTNKGGGNAGPSTLRLIVWKAGKLAQKEAANVVVKVPALASSETTSVVVTAGIAIRRAKHSLYIDISEDAK